MRPKFWIVIVLLTSACSESFRSSRSNRPNKPSEDAGTLPNYLDEVTRTIEPSKDEVLVIGGTTVKFEADTTDVPVFVQIRRLAPTSGEDDTEVETALGQAVGDIVDIAVYESDANRVVIDASSLKRAIQVTTNVNVESEPTSIRVAMIKDPERSPQVLESFGGSEISVEETTSALRLAPTSYSVRFSFRYPSARIWAFVDDSELVAQGGSGNGSGTQTSSGSGSAGTASDGSTASTSGGSGGTSGSGGSEPARAPGFALLPSLCAGTPTSTLSGTGTEADPYIVCWPAQLSGLKAFCSDNCPNKYFLQAANIDMTGVSYEPFNLSGHYDGNHHTISNLTVSRTGEAAFIGTMNGSLRNLKFQSINLSSASNAAVISNANTSATVQILNVHVTGVSTISGQSSVGGLVAISEAFLYIKDSSVTAEISASGFATRAGGLVGASEYELLHIRSSHATGSISNSSAGGSTGGLVGMFYLDDLVIEHSSTTVDLTSVANASGHSVGGVAGRLDLNSGSFRIAEVVISTRLPTSGDTVRGAVVGRIDSGAVVEVLSAVYFDQTEAGAGMPPIGTGSFTVGSGMVSGLSTSSMKSSANLTGLSFGSHWYIEDGADYPRLVRLPGGCDAALAAGQSYSDFDAIGSGTELDPYLICTGAQLNQIGVDADGCGSGGTAACSKYFALGADIVMPAGTNNMIGTVGTAFYGYFDGRFRTISQFKTPDDSAVGVFRYLESIGPSPVVRNLGIVDAVVAGSKDVGILAGQYRQSTITGARFAAFNIFTTGSVTTASQNNNDGNIGGLIGLVDPANPSTVFRAVYSEADITVTTNGRTTGSIGGLIGFLDGQGGIEIELKDTYYSGSLTVQGNSASNLGGVVGKSTYASIARTYSKGQLNASSSLYNVGGLIGEFYGSGATVSDSYSQISFSSTAGGSNVGGLVGMLTDAGVDRSYAAVSGSLAINGAIFGESVSTEPISFVFWDSELMSSTSYSAPGGNAGGTYSRTTAQMRSRSNFDNSATPFPNWDFANVWKIEDGVSYPKLRWEP